MKTEIHRWFHRTWQVTLLATALFVTGCPSPTENGGSGTSQSTTPVSNSSSSEEEPSNSNQVASRPMNNGGAADSATERPSGIRVTTLGGGRSRNTRPESDQALNETDAVARLMEQFEEYAAQDRVVVAWVFDQSVQSEGICRAAAGGLLDYMSEHPEGKIELLIAGAGNDTTWLNETPSAQSSEIGSAVDKIAFQPEPSLTFAGMSAALDKLAPLQAERAMVSVVLVSGSVGSDWQEADAVAEKSRSMGAPIYVIGYPAPFGMASLRNNMGEADERTYGPETPEPEFIPFQFANEGTGIALLDSGFGPWGLERVSRAGGGTFLAIRPAASRFANATSYDTLWPSDNAPRFDPVVLARYAPNYGSLEEYRAARDGNKAISALLTVARRYPVARTIQNPIMQFDARDEAALKTALDVAQQPAALLSPNLNVIADILAEGEKDREKLTDPRWQAAYDLAMGQALANVVRVDGYNGMLAQLKTGKSFSNPKSDQWSLEPSDTIDTTSLMKNKLNAAREYLQRVIDEHPGTPWAYIAERELEIPIGYEWKEIDSDRR